MILVTGGTGYIGSHTVVEMLAANLEPLILDNFSNSSPRVVDSIEHIAGKVSGKEPDSYSSHTRTIR